MKASALSYNAGLGSQRLLEASLPGSRCRRDLRAGSSAKIRRKFGVGAAGGMGSSWWVVWNTGEVEDEGLVLKSHRRRKSQCGF